MMSYGAALARTIVPGVTGVKHEQPRFVERTQHRAGASGGHEHAAGRQGDADVAGSYRTDGPDDEGRRRRRVVTVAARGAAQGRRSQR